MWHHLIKDGKPFWYKAAYLKVPPFVVSNKFRPCLRLFTRAQLTGALDACVQADLDYRSGKIDAARAVEILILSV